MNDIYKQTMRELPVSERPYEKCLEFGPEVLSNAELLAVILKSGTKKETALDISIRLLTLYQGENALADLFDSSVDELKEVPGIGDVKAISLLCVGELSRRIARETTINKIKLSNPESIASYFMEQMRHLDQEEIRAAFFDTKCNFIRDVRLTIGTVNSSLLTPRELFIKALKYKAVFIVLIHNHPSGDPEPSKDDILLTARIKEAGSIMSIPLMDHIIIGDKVFLSFKDKGML